MRAQRTITRRLPGWIFTMPAVAGLACLPLALASNADAAKFSERAQVTLGGAEYFVNGKITKIEGDYYWIEEPSGDEVRIRVADGTNMVCATHEQQKAAQTSSGKEPRATTRKIARPAADAAGFRLGDCPFQVGERVKAEVDDEGEATFVRYLAREPESQTAAMGLPQRYVLLPVQYGELFARNVSHYPVKTTKGEPIGVMERVIIDQSLGDIEFGVVTLADGRLMPIPWSVVTFDPDTKVVTIQVQKQHLVQMPAFRARISMQDVRDYWEREGGGDWFKRMKGPYASRWVREVVQDIANNPKLRQAFKDNPHQPAATVALLNRAADELTQHHEAIARDYYARAMAELDQDRTDGYLNDGAVRQLETTITVHAPRQLVAAVEGAAKRMSPSLSMAQAIKVAEEEYPGKVVEATYLGKYGENAYVIRIMAGTGITREIEVAGNTGTIRSSTVVAGAAMPDEPFR